MIYGSGQLLSPSNTMIWKKLGIIFNLDNPINDDIYSHATNPLPIQLEGSIYRIFFSARDRNGKSNVSFFDYNLDNHNVVSFNGILSLKHGNHNQLDAAGISIGCVLDNTVYYMAWQNSNNQHWRGDIAFAVLSQDLKLLQKPKNNLFMGIDKEDRISLSYPFILKDGNIFHLWYGSTESWDYGNGEMLHIIKYATSDDMQHWTKHGCCLSYVIGSAQAFSRPCVLKLNDVWHMWYSYRGNKDKYKIGYASSLNGKEWDTFHDNKNVIHASLSGWDSEMVCYPYVFKHGSHLYMLYNGNQYGKTGIGLAVCDIEKV